MPARKTLKDVQEFLKKNDINHECTLLSTNYVNNTTPLEFQCNLCGNIFTKDWSHLQRQKYFTCPSCSQKRVAKKLSYDIDYVKSFLQEHDLNHECTLLSTEYKNSYTPLKFRCNICGQEFNREFQMITRKDKKTSFFGCQHCFEEIFTSGKLRIKYTKEKAEEILSQEGYSIVGEYKDANTKVKCQCDKGHICNIKIYDFMRGIRCKQCYIDSIVKENNKAWTGGGIPQNLRHVLSSRWRTECLIQAGYKCDISGSSENLEVHHLVNFKDLLELASQNTGIPIYSSTSQYTLEERQLLTQELIALHDPSLGVVLSRKYHILFHQLYGKEHNTPEQYIEFKEKIRKDKLYGISNTNPTDDSTQ